jgi:hypothetical protein
MQAIILIYHLNGEYQEQPQKRCEAAAKTSVQRFRLEGTTCVASPHRFLLPWQASLAAARRPLDLL